MKKYLILTVLSLFCVFIYSCMPRTTVREVEPRATIDIEKVTEGKIIGLKRKVAVIKFENKVPYGKQRLGDSAADILTTELSKSQRVILVERERVYDLLEEKKMQETGQYQMDAMVSAGKILGLNAIVTGSVSQFGVKTEGVDYLLFETKIQVAEATVDLRIVDVGSGRILWADTGKGTAMKKVTTFLGLGGRASYDEILEGEALRAAIVKFVKNIIEQIDKTPWFCYVAEVRGEKIYLDAGINSGLKVGTELKVIRPGSDIISPGTGIKIGTTEEEIGTVIVVSHFGDNGSIAEFKSGNKPLKGDMCEFLKSP